MTRDLALIFILVLAYLLIVCGALIVLGHIWWGLLVGLVTVPVYHGARKLCAK